MPNSKKSYFGLLGLIIVLITGLLFVFLNYRFHNNSSPSLAKKEEIVNFQEEIKEKKEEINQEEKNQEIKKREENKEPEKNEIEEEKENIFLKVLYIIMMVIFIIIGVILIIIAILVIYFNYHYGDNREMKNEFYGSIIYLVIEVILISCLFFIKRGKFSVVIFIIQMVLVVFLLSYLNFKNEQEKVNKEVKLNIENVYRINEIIKERNERKEN